MMGERKIAGTAGIQVRLHQRSAIGLPMHGALNWLINRLSAGTAYYKVLNNNEAL